MFQVIFDNQDKYFKVIDLKDEKTLAITTALVPDTYFIHGGDIRIALQEGKDGVEAFSINAGIVTLSLNDDIKVLDAKLIIVD